MKINFQETTKDLQVRIDIHNQFGGKNIDEWMLDLLKLEKGINILDVACGAGKQIISFYNELDGNCSITGGDVSQELLDQAQEEVNKRKMKAVNIIELDFNKPFPIEDNQFDLVSCCFAIYYAQDIPFTIKEIHRVLKPGGRLFTTGPMPENKQLFYDIIREATNDKPIPPMPGSSRYNFEIRETIEGLFSKTEVNRFNNPLTFASPEPFLAYTRASLSEDRKLWKDFFSGEDDFETVMAKIGKAAKRRAETDGKLVMEKVVGGFVATK
ncbi:MAG: methyltransferase domain-containing protein [Anaerolineaceae bacterium]|nr:methyltransferase domain-containing protein [Anaerolineaceae bacterium]